MKNRTKLLEYLLDYLKENEIQFSRVSAEKLKEKAVVKFSFSLDSPPCILCGPFQDRKKELISIAHEAGHVLLYRKMNKEEVRAYLCTMFAANRMGIDKISPLSQEFILDVEFAASVKGLGILGEIGLEDSDLQGVKMLMSRWYATYEKLCMKDVAGKVREKIGEDKKAGFLVSPEYRN